MTTIDGILIIDKPDGLTSHDIVARARRILGTRRIGHSGTLDPFATGVLVLCVGRMTRLSQFLTAAEKEYEAVMRLGAATDTGDLTGKILEPVRDTSGITDSDINACLNEFRGHIQQVPPMYAAKKVGGVRLYEMARRGEVIERQPIDVDIRELEVIDRPQLLLEAGDVALRVVCSAGTYIRTLAEDIGARLGTGAHLIALRRTRSGKCTIANATSLEKLAELGDAGRLSEAFQDVTAVIGLETLTIDRADELRIRNGVAVKSLESEDRERALLCSENGAVLAVAELDREAKQWRPRVVVAGD